MIERLLAHDRWTTQQLLIYCEPLEDSLLDQSFGIGHDTIRKTFDHIIHNVETWSSLMVGDVVERQADCSIDGMQRRLDIAANRLASVADDISARNAWDEQWIDVLEDPPRKKSYGTAIAHVLTHSMHHRAQLLYMMRRAGLTSLPEGDVFSWEDATQNQAKSDSNH